MTKKKRKKGLIKIKTGQWLEKNKISNFAKKSKTCFIKTQEKRENFGKANQEKIGKNK